MVSRERKREKKLQKKDEGKQEPFHLIFSRHPFTTLRCKLVLPK